MAPLVPGRASSAATSDAPQRPIARSTLRPNPSSTARTPADPLVANPHMIGLPTMTARAPRARALTTSTPSRMPPSTYTSAPPATASTTSGSATAVAMQPSSCRPPWLETAIASAPASTQRAASSPRTMPLTTIGSPLHSLSSARSSNVTDGSNPATSANRSASFVGVRRGSSCGIRMPGGGAKRARSLRGRRDVTAQSTVTTTAEHPVSWARAHRSAVSPRSRCTLSCSHRGVSGAAAAMSSSEVDALIDTTMTVSAAAAATPISPSGWNMRCSAVGATTTGQRISVPSTVVDVSMFDTSRSIRGRNRSRSQAATLSATVTSAPAPLSRYSHTMWGRTERASASSSARSSIGVTSVPRSAGPRWGMTRGRHRSRRG